MISSSFIGLVFAVSPSPGTETRVEELLATKERGIRVEEMLLVKNAEEPVEYPQIRTSLLRVAIQGDSRLHFGVKFTVVQSAERFETYFLDSDELMSVRRTLREFEVLTGPRRPVGFEHAQYKYIITRGGMVVSKEMSYEYVNSGGWLSIPFAMYEPYRQGFWVGRSHPSNPSFPFGAGMTHIVRPQLFRAFQLAISAAIEWIHWEAPDQLRSKPPQLEAGRLWPRIGGN